MEVQIRFNQQVKRAAGLRTEDDRVSKQKDSSQSLTAAGAKPALIKPVKRQIRHREVFEAVLSEITSGRLQPGDRMPSEAELTKTFSASRTTVSRAMRDLKHQGLLDRQRGGGTRVARRASKRVALFTPFAESATGLGFMGANVYAHLANLASNRGDHLSLQLIARVDDDPLKLMLAAADNIIKERVHGVFYYPVELPAAQAHYNQTVVAKLMAAGMAVVLVDREVAVYPDRSPITIIKYDNARGGYLVTDHIIQRGRKRIAFVSICNISSAASDRMRGYQNALLAAGISVEPGLMKRAGVNDLTSEFWRSLIEVGKPDAVICNSDRYAASVGRHLETMGLKVGSDVLLAGFGDQPFAEMLAAPLTTVRFPLAPFTSVCYDRLIQKMGTADSIVPEQILVDVELVVRASTAGTTA